MALVPKISARTLNCCQLLQVKDITMAYDVSLNPTGWGSPNIEHSDVVSATVAITYPNGTKVTEDVSVAFQVGTDPFDLCSLSPVGATFPDGVYLVEYTIFDGADTYYTSVQISMDCNVSCCVDKMFSRDRKSVV